MEKDFHYYLIYAVSKITGFEKADIIASSSQFVDDNNEGQFSIDDLLAERSLGMLPKYSKHDWIDAALDGKEEQIVMREGFEKTDWYLFHQAAKVHFATVLELTKEL